jgi:hypothetical protein
MLKELPGVLIICDVYKDSNQVVAEFLSEM